MEPLTTLLLFSASIIIGIYAVLFGATLFLSLPLFQILFPDMAVGALIGNIKLGSILRNAAAIRSLRKHLLWSLWPFAGALCVGSVVGALFISSVTLWFIPVVLVLGLSISERADKINIPKQWYWVAAFLVGCYGGILGAGISLLLIAFMQMHKLDHVSARTNALALELVISLVAVMVFWQFDLIDWPIALTWAAGGIIGGLVGGRLIDHTGSYSKQTQRWLLRAGFMIALLVSIITLL